MVSESFVQKQYLISCQSIQNPILSPFITFCDIVGGSGYFWLVEKISCTWKSLKYEVCSSVRVGWTFHHTLVVYTSGQWPRAGHLDLEQPPRPGGCWWRGGAQFLFVHHTHRHRTHPVQPAQGSMHCGKSGVSAQSQHQFRMTMAMDAQVYYFVHVEIIQLYLYGVNWSYGRIICSFHRKEC